MASPARPKCVTVIGASGFIGSTVASALAGPDVVVQRIQAPRMLTSTAAVDDLRLEAAGCPDVDALTRVLHGSDVVVNAAGVADAGADSHEVLLGANALLPRVILESCRRAKVDRFVHISSSGVQGRTRQLDETPTTAAFSPYTRSKALAEAVLAGEPGVILFRPTSVHGRSRAVSAALARFSRSRLASVSAPGTTATPQVLVDNVASAVTFVALYDGDVPPIILQPSEGLTASSLLEVLGSKRPIKVPRLISRTLLASLIALSPLSSKLSAISRRLEMVWFGQDQEPGWLASAGWTPPVGREGWRAIAEHSARATPGDR